MSAAEKVQQHPVYMQASHKANYYVAQIDKEVPVSLSRRLVSSVDQNCIVFAAVQVQYHEDAGGA